MTDISLPATRFSECEFRVGNAMNKAVKILSRNVLPFSLMAGIAAVPTELVMDRSATAAATYVNVVMILGGILLSMVLDGLLQAIVVHPALENMRGRPADIMASFRASWPRFPAVIGLTLLSTLFAFVAAFGLVFPAFILVTIWFVAAPACVVEKLGPFKSLGRSAALTKGSRWRVFGMFLVIFLLGVLGGMIVEALADGVGPTIAPVVRVVWQALVSAYIAILVVVTYHDLRVAKEGVDTNKIAAVFE